MKPQAMSAYSDPKLQCIFTIRSKWPNWLEYVWTLSNMYAVTDRSVRAIVSAQYLPMQSTADASSRATLHKQLEEWESNLPNELRLGNNSTPSATFLVGLLHMTYKCVEHHVLISLRY